MKWPRDSTVSLLIYSFLILGLGKAKAEMVTIFNDDYDAVWDATPIP